MSRRTVHINDIDVVYEDTGQGEPVVFLHGLGSSREDWRAQVAALSARFRCVAMDLRGHGETGRRRGPVTMAQLAEDAAALVRTLELGPVHVVGVSLGGRIAFQLAVDDPEIVRSLTIVNSGPEVVPRRPAEWAALYGRLFLTWCMGPAWLGRRIAKRVFPRAEQEPLRRGLERRLAANDRRAYLATTRAIVGWSVADRLGEITCPVLVVSGDRDYTPVERKAAYAQRLPRSRLVVIEDSGHATPIDQPRRFNERVAAFLAGVA
jgi:pimeloyl-ACP methyl ester carboxylesterase